MPRHETRLQELLAKPEILRTAHERAEIDRLRDEAPQPPSSPPGPRPGSKPAPGHRGGVEAPPMRIRATDDMPEDRIQASGEMPD